VQETNDEEIWQLIVVYGSNAEVSCVTEKELLRHVLEKARRKCKNSRRLCIEIRMLMLLKDTVVYIGRSFVIILLVPGLVSRRSCLRQSRGN